MIDLKAWGLFFLRYATEIGLFFAILIGLVFAMFRTVARPQAPLSRELVGATGVALTAVSGLEGRVSIGGREIRAIAETRIGVGSRIRVVEVDGLIAKVAEDAV